jgi:hypothetical protein
MLDEEFMQSVGSCKARFGKDDILDATALVKQNKSSSGLKMEWYVLVAHGHEKPLRQAVIFRE